MLKSEVEDDLLKADKFMYGDRILIEKSAIPHLHPREIVSVCSVIKIEPEDTEKQASLIEPT
jgi:hypothetical protein